MGSEAWARKPLTTMERPLVWQRAIHLQPGLVPSAAPIISWTGWIKAEPCPRSFPSGFLPYQAAFKQFFKLIRSMFPDFHRFFDVVCWLRPSTSQFSWKSRPPACNGNRVKWNFWVYQLSESSLRSQWGHSYGSALQGNTTISVNDIPNSKEVCVIKWTLITTFSLPLLYSMKPEASIVAKYKSILSKSTAYFQSTKYTFKVQNYTFDWQKFTFKVQKHTFNVQKHAFNVQAHIFQWTKTHLFNVQIYSFNVQNYTFKVQRYTFQVHKYTFKVQKY